ncbi:MAG: hypothetical protein OET90_02610, partial [Desulfuromonadales bacterium]|nr:hypothetical protein [Desulfuromonadales bacterium]
MSEQQIEVTLEQQQIVVTPDLVAATLPQVSQAQAEDATDVGLYSWTPQRVWQAILKWAGSASSIFQGSLSGASELIVTVDVSDAQEITVDYCNCLRLNIDETVASFSLTKGDNWPAEGLG